MLAEAAERLASEGDGRQKARLDREGAVQALKEFQPLWQALSPGEQRRLMQLLVERVAYDAANGRVSITFRPTGIATLAATDATDATHANTGQQGGHVEPHVEEAVA